MSDDSKRGPADSTRINIHEDYELRYWSEKSSCTREQLVDAIGSVGVMADKVELYLSGKR